MNDLKDIENEDVIELYDEYIEASSKWISYRKAQQICAIDDEETSFLFDGELVGFELDLPDMMPFDNDFPKFVTIKYANGATCATCNEIFPYAAESNQRDGTFKCYSCKNYG